MNEQEINKTIAEHMGLGTSGEFMPDSDHIPVLRLRDGEPSYIKAYTASLDACVPVVEKLSRDIGRTLAIKINLNVFCTWFCMLDGDIGDDKTTPSLALATALAMKIKSLGEA